MRMQKVITAVAAAGAAALLAVSAVGAQDAGEAPRREDKRHRMGACGGRMGRHHMGAKMRVVHSETKVATDGGTFTTHIVDTGTVTGVDGDRVNIRRADNETVSVAASADTKVCRNGEEASVSDLKPGDRAAVVQSERDGSKTVRGIRAFSEDFEPPARPDRRQQRRLRPPAATDTPAQTSV